MKKVLLTLLITSIVVFSACSAPKNSENSGVDVSPSPEVSESPKESTSPQVSESTSNNDSIDAATETLNNYLEAYKKNDYDILKEFLYTEYLVQTADEMINNLQENDFKLSTERTEFLTTITDYDNKHKLVKLIIKGTNINGPFSSDELFGLVHINGEWKIDYSLFVASESIPVNVENDFLRVYQVEKITYLDRYRFNVSFKNILENNQIITGWANQETSMKIITDKGTFDDIFGIVSVDPLKSHTLQYDVKTTEPLVIESIAINNLFLGKSGLKIPGSEPFEIIIPLK